MDKNNLNNTNPAEGKWIAVDAASLGFQLNGAPGQEVKGPDGHTYRIGQSEAQLSQVSGNSNNAIPTPSSIVQMPPIVQPIALVPYTSQNQPLLQYDPYSRPVDPQIEPQAPNYVRKPYRGISITAFFLSLIGAVLFVFLAVATFKADDIRPAFSFNGLDSILALLASFGVSATSKYHKHRIVPNQNRIPADLLSTIITYAVPVFATLIILIFAGLAIKYLFKLGKKKTPRAFSFGAFINMILSLSIAGMLLGMTNAEVAIADRSANVAKFFSFEASIVAGIGLILAFVFSLILFILPFFAKKNAYMLEKEDAAKRTFVIDD